MKLTMTARNMTITPAITQRIEKKTSRMGRYLTSDTEMQIRLSKEKNGLRKAEITVPMGGGTLLRAEGEAEDNLFLAIDAALTRIEKQIHRHRTRLGRKLREDAFQQEPEYMDEEVPEEEAAQVVRRKTFPVRPMSEEDAIIEMELLGHSFFAFVNADTGATNVLYRRKDGALGLLEPEA